jgi:asparagine synthase (glutamine-hydrolysing)
MDNDLIEAVYRLPRKQKFNGWKLKTVLKEISYDFLPKHILERPKSGFHLPLAQWYTEELKDFVEEKLSEERLSKIPQLNTQEVRNIIDEHLNFKFDNSFKITCLLVFVEWHELFIQNFNEK